MTSPREETMDDNVASSPHAVDAPSPPEFEQPSQDLDVRLFSSPIVSSSPTVEAEQEDSSDPILFPELQATQASTEGIPDAKGQQEIKDTIDVAEMGRKGEDQDETTMVPKELSTAKSASGGNISNVTTHETPTHAETTQSNPATVVGKLLALTDPSNTLPESNSRHNIRKQEKDIVHPADDESSQNNEDDEDEQDERVLVYPPAPWGRRTRGGSNFQVPNKRLITSLIQELAVVEKRKQTEEAREKKRQAKQERPTARPVTRAALRAGGSTTSRSNCSTPPSTTATDNDTGTESSYHPDEQPLTRTSKRKTRQSNRILYNHRRNKAAKLYHTTARNKSNSPAASTPTSEYVPRSTDTSSVRSLPTHDGEDQEEEETLDGGQEVFPRTPAADLPDKNRLEIKFTRWDGTFIQREASAARTAAHRRGDKKQAWLEWVELVDRKHNNTEGKAEHGAEVVPRQVGKRRATRSSSSRASTNLPLPPLSASRPLRGTRKHTITTAEESNASASAQLPIGNKTENRETEQNTENDQETSGQSRLGESSIASMRATTRSLRARRATARSTNDTTHDNKAKPHTAPPTKETPKTICNDRLDDVRMTGGEVSEDDPENGPNNPPVQFMTDPYGRKVKIAPSKWFVNWWLQTKMAFGLIEDIDSPFWVGVHGNVLTPKTMVWHTSLIVCAPKSDIVKTVTGSFYALRGTLDTEKMRLHGFSEKIIEAFANGFPPNWKELLEEHYSPTQYKAKQKRLAEIKEAASRTKREPSPPEDSIDADLSSMRQTKRVKHGSSSSTPSQGTVSSSMPTRKKQTIEIVIPVRKKAPIASSVVSPPDIPEDANESLVASHDGVVQTAQPPISTREEQPHTTATTMATTTASANNSTLIPITNTRTNTDTNTNTKTSSKQSPSNSQRPSIFDIKIPDPCLPSTTVEKENEGNAEDEEKGNQDMGEEHDGQEEDVAAEERQREMSRTPERPLPLLVEGLSPGLSSHVARAMNTIARLSTEISAITRIDSTFRHEIDDNDREDDDHGGEGIEPLFRDMESAASAKSTDATATSSSAGGSKLDRSTGLFRSLSSISMSTSSPSSSQPQIPAETGLDETMAELEAAAAVEKPLSQTLSQTSTKVNNLSASTPDTFTAAPPPSSRRSLLGGIFKFFEGATGRGSGQRSHATSVHATHSSAAATATESSKTNLSGWVSSSSSSKNAAKSKNESRSNGHPDNRKNDTNPNNVESDQKQQSAKEAREASVSIRTSITRHGMNIQSQSRSLSPSPLSSVAASSRTAGVDKEGEDTSTDNAMTKAEGDMSIDEETSYVDTKLAHAQRESNNGDSDKDQDGDKADDGMKRAALHGRQEGHDKHDEVSIPSKTVVESTEKGSADILDREVTETHASDAPFTEQSEHGGGDDEQDMFVELVGPTSDEAVEEEQDDEVPVIRVLNHTDSETPSAPPPKVNIRALQEHARHSGRAEDSLQTMPDVITTTISTTSISSALTVKSTTVLREKETKKDTVRDGASPTALEGASPSNTTVGREAETGGVERRLGVDETAADTYKGGVNDTNLELSTYNHDNAILIRELTTAKTFEPNDPEEDWFSDE
ncbi:hypothetical protein BGW42_008341 [Actinomortierella wolfii]|nr:hypothetical protein BGW42_008341 [Actinomortierella wolfii]